uniref:Uncharacterized protein LOC109548847 n=1 Tax=Tursiops truncatus TaxID=9739 RepID=A0A6J3RED5_TURTR|nr:uncharacterized protein LOC109548847 [Tursiops truncatus]
MFSQPPTFQEHEVEGHRRTGEIPWAVRVARQSPSRLTTGWSSPLLHPHPCSRSTPTHGPPASQRHRLAAGCKDAPPTEGEPEAGRATALGVPEPRESESSRTWGKAAGDSGHARGCRAAQARCWPHSRDQIRFSGLERVGCRGLSWLLGRRGEKGDAEGGRLFRRADLLLGWRGPGWTNPSVRLCWAPHRVRDLSEDEINPPRKVQCNFPKPGTRLEYTPRAWGQFSPGMTTYLCAGHQAMADLLFQSPAATNNPVRRVYYVVPSFPFGNPEQIILSTGRAAEIPWSCSCHQISARCTVITIPLFSKKMHSGHPFNSRKLWYP